MNRTNNKPGENFSQMLASQYQIPENQVTISIIQTTPLFYEYQVREPDLIRGDAEIIKSLRSHFSRLFKDKKRNQKFLQNFLKSWQLKLQDNFHLCLLIRVVHMSIIYSGMPGDLARSSHSSMILLSVQLR